MAFLWQVAFEGLEEERGCLLNFTEFKENLNDSIDWCLGVTCCIPDCDHFCEVNSSL